MHSARQLSTKSTVSTTKRQFPNSKFDERILGEYCKLNNASF